MSLWDLKAPLYRWFRSPWPLNVIHQKELRLVRELYTTIPEQHGRRLDLGCGAGGSLNIHNHYNNLYGLDKSPAMLKQLSDRKSPPPIAGDALHLPFQDNSFTVITAMGLSEYIAELEGLLTECSRCLQAGGYLLLTGSPPTLFTRLRMAGGSRIWPRTSGELFARADNEFKLLSENTLFSLTGLLLKKQY